MTVSDGIAREMAIEQRDETRLLVTALARGESYATAAAAAGVSERTVERRMADPAFRALIAEALRVAVADGARQLVASIPMAVSTLQEVMGREGAAEKGAGVRHKAAVDVLKLASELTTSHSLLSEVFDRLRRLEDA